MWEWGIIGNGKDFTPIYCPSYCLEKLGLDIGEHQIDLGAGGAVSFNVVLILQGAY